MASRQNRKAQIGYLMRGPFRPEYLWRPSQITRRISFRPSEQVECLALPWNCTIHAASADAIGRSIATQGVYDLPLTEAVMRLTDAGDTALDVGANIGYVSLVLALSTGPRGRVFCFEPNPSLLPTLRANVDNWSSLDAAPIQIETIALSDHNGEGVLGFPDDYATNRGLASLELKNGGIPVCIRRLDSLEIDRPRIMKVDVEGHEAAVFGGAERLLARKLIRDILFEEHEPYPTKSQKILLEHGYHIFRLTGSAWRPMLLPPDSFSRDTNRPPNYLATADPSRALARFASWGWRSLSKLRRHQAGLNADPHGNNGKHE